MGVSPGSVDNFCTVPAGTATVVPMLQPPEDPLIPGQLALVRAELDRGHGTLLTADLTRSGVGPEAVRWLVSRAVLTRVARGAFVDGALHNCSDENARHVLRATAIARSWPRGVMVSHTSAALMRQLPLTVRPDRVHGSRSASGQHRRTATHTIHTGYSDARSTSINGVEVIEPRFIVMGAAELHGRDEAVVVGDAALQRGLVTVDDLRRTASSRSHHRSHAIFTRALELMDGRSESPGESLSRLLIIALGHVPVPQVVIHDDAGFIGRVDFLIEGTRVIVEFDGLGKYSSSTDLAAEKRREMRLRRAGYTVVRLIWADLHNPSRVRQLLLDAIAADSARA